MLYPHFDQDTKLMFLSGKGDGNVRYFEIQNDTMHYISDYRSTAPVKGLDFLPKHAMNVGKHEVMRAVYWILEDTDGGRVDVVLCYNSYV